MSSNTPAVILYKPRTGWSVYSEKVEKEEGTGLDIIKVSIGEATAEDGSKQSLIEPIYADLLQDIAANQMDYSFYPAVAQIPQVFIIRKGTIVLHNDGMRMLCDLMKDAISGEDEQLLEKALYEWTSPVRRKQEEKFSMNKLNADISSKLQAPVQMEFMGAYLRNYFIDKYTQNPAAAYINNLDTDSLLKLCCEMNSFYLQREYRGENLQKLASDMNVEMKDIFNLVRRDVYVRFITGRLTGGKGGMK